MTSGTMRVGFKSGGAHTNILQLNRNLVNVRGGRLNGTQPATIQRVFPINKLGNPILTPDIALTWNRTVSPQKKWNPGHYMNSPTRTNSTNSNLSQKNQQIDILLTSGPNVQGIMLKYQWPGFWDSVNNVFRFDFLDIDYTRTTGIAHPGDTPTGKRIIVQVMTDIFGGSGAAVVPADVYNNPGVYGAPPSGKPGGGYWTFDGGSNYVACLWRTAVMNRLIAMYQALANHVLPSGNTVDNDPYIEQMMSFEIASPIGADAGAGYNATAYQTAWHSFIDALAAAFPHTCCIAEINFGDNPQWTADMVTYLQSKGWGGGGPDMWGKTYLTGVSPYNGSPDKMSWGQQRFAGVLTATYPSNNPGYFGQMPWSQEVEDEELYYGYQFPGQFAGSPYMPQDIMNTARDLLARANNQGGITHILWQWLSGSGPAIMDATTYKNISQFPGNWQDQVLPMINANPIPFTGYPTNLP